MLTKEQLEYVKATIEQNIDDEEFMERLKAAIAKRQAELDAEREAREAEEAARAEAAKSEGMMVFNNPEFGNVRTIEEDGKILFCAIDVARALGYNKPRNAIAAHCRGALKRGGVSQTTNQHGVTTDQVVEMSFIPESDLYRLVFSSKLPTAEKFTDWVTEEVLPAIRKNGGYIAGQESMTNEELLAKAVLVAQNTIAEKDKRIAQQNVKISQLTVENEALLPKAQYFDALVEKGLLTNFRDTAKALGVKPREFTKFLKEKKYIYEDSHRQLRPYSQRNNGYFELKESMNKATGWAGVQTFVTPKGREAFRMLLGV